MIFMIYLVDIIFRAWFPKLPMRLRVVHRIFNNILKFIILREKKYFTNF